MSIFMLSGVWVAQAGGPEVAARVQQGLQGHGISPREIGALQNSQRIQRCSAEA